MTEPDADPVVLPASFLRGLESDLRALCAEAKRHDASVKDVAERVILQLKEADSEAASVAAADEAAAAFCAACAPPDAAAGSAAAPNPRVVIRAVSCLHKLLTHRAVSHARLPAVIDALQLLGVASADDAVTLKVLQALLSLLTVPSYLRALPQNELSRAISLLFMLRTGRSGAAAAAAAGPLSAISAVAQKLDSDEDGVIEVTAQASFRQVASDLFAAATDAMSKAENLGSTGSIDALAPVAQSAYALFQDMCSVVAGDETQWVTALDVATTSAPRRVGRILALEVIDDCLAGNVFLFSAASNPLFSVLLSSRLCPAVHELLLSDAARPVQKALYGLVVTLLRKFWTDLLPDSEVLLKCMARFIDTHGVVEPPSWATVYAMDAVCALFRDPPANRERDNEPILLSLFNAFDMRRDSAPYLIADLIVSACKSATAHVEDGRTNMSSLPVAPMKDTFKPFSASSGNMFNMYVASAAGMCLSVSRAAQTAGDQGDTHVLSRLLSDEVSSVLITFLRSLLSEVPCGAKSPGLESIVDGLTSIASTGNKLSTGLARELVTSCLCTNATRALGSFSGSEDRVVALYRGVYAVERACGEYLGNAWRDVVDAFHSLDAVLYGEILSVSLPDAAKPDGSAPQHVAATAVGAALKPLASELEDAFSFVTTLSWKACSDVISALVVSSRATLASLSQRLAGEDSAGSRIASSRAAKTELRVFGIARAESVISCIFARSSSPTPEAMPHGLWQLLTGHLVGVACDSGIPGIRVTAVGSLTRIASCALESNSANLVPQDKVVAPLTDLLSSSFADTREGCLRSVYVILETRGEHLQGSAAWSTILAILRTAVRDVGGGSNETSADDHGAEVKVVRRDVERPSEGMVQGGFHAVQLIADDFLSFLAFETLSDWIRVVELYAQQVKDVNVALTAVGLLWRTADHFAKHCGEAVYDSLWMDLFEVLKALGCDGRPEVRNGAVKTLTSTLAAHGSRLTAAGWKGCVERALVPLLEEVMLGGVPTIDGESQARSKVDSNLVLHHSRDTPRKQWNETRVLALSGVASVLRKAMPHIAGLRDVDGRPLLRLLADGGHTALWTKMLRAASAAASSEENEVALAGVGALLELLNGASALVPKQRERLQLGDVGAGTSEEEVDTGDSVSGAIALWEAVWEAICEAVCGNASRGAEESPISNKKALVILAKGLGSARAEYAERFTPKSSAAFLDIMSHLVCCEQVSKSSSPPDILPGELSIGSFTDVQETALSVIESLSFGNEDSTWTVLVSKILGIVSFCQFLESDLPMRRLIALVGSLYEGKRMPDSVKSAELHRVILTLGEIMLKYHRGAFCASPVTSPIPAPPPLKSGDTAPPLPVALPGLKGSRPAANRQRSNISESRSDREWTAADGRDPLWIVAVQSFTTASRHGLEAGSPNEAFWPAYRRIASEFLYGPWRVVDDVILDPRALAELALFESFDVKLAHCIRDALAGMTDCADDELQSALVGVLARGAQEGMCGKRPRYVRSCQSCMFSLADSEWSVGRGTPSVRKKIAAQAAECVVRVSDSVLGRFVADSHRAGKCPMPAERRAEAVFLLRRLQSLRLGSDADDARKHLRSLHPRLCECVDGGDDAVRILAQAVIQLVS